MAWVYLLVGSLFEIAWAMGLKLSEGFTQPLISAITVALIFISFYFFTKALREIDIGTGYAVFTGIGTIGTTIIGILMLGDKVSFTKLLFIIILITGIIGLKVTSTQNVPSETTH
ncbi:DMT family transporter [Thalassobacillus hwangdonensis]|uniref:DMT family transporter n=1 Tax=Thalassobacillus hwangdonensis TaxID=546108 RepID=A0ABW3L692_9BACI